MVLKITTISDVALFAEALQCRGSFVRRQRKEHSKILLSKNFYRTTGRFEVEARGYLRNTGGEFVAPLNKTQITLNTTADLINIEDAEGRAMRYFVGEYVRMLERSHCKTKDD